jgi:tripartite-type tricarboxylate transporter receptor subunit TctC
MKFNHSLHLYGVLVMSESTVNLKRRRLLTVGGALALPAVVASPARAQAWPNKPIKLVVPSAAGGAPDLICRLLGSELSKLLGQAIVIDNKPGAGGAIGMQEISRAAPDGYTLGYGNVVTLSINRHLYSKLPYDPDALSGIALLGTVQNALVVRPTLGVNSVAELIALAKSKPGRLSMGSAGNGTTGHLGGEMFKALTGTFITHIPYRGSPMAIQDLIGGQIDLMFDNLSSCGPHIRAGRLKALAVSGAKRSALFPQLPTVAETGVKNYETTAWGGIVGPNGLAPELIQKLNEGINKVLDIPNVRDKYRDMAFETIQSAPSLIMAMARLESPKWADVIRRSGAKVE